MHVWRPTDHGTHNCITVVVFQEIIIDESVGTVELNRFCRDFYCQLRGKILGIRQLLRMADASSPEISTVIHQPPCCLDLDRHFSYYPLHELKAREWLSKLVPFLSIFKTSLKTALGND